MANGPREQAYDEHISPLMTQIIALCKEHKIPVVAKFELDFNEEQDSPLFCTTSIVDKDSHESMRKLSQDAARREAPAIAFTIVSSPKEQR